MKKILNTIIAITLSLFVFSSFGCSPKEPLVIKESDTYIVITVSNEVSFYKYFDSSNRLISVSSDIADRVRINKKLYKLYFNMYLIISQVYDIIK